MADVSVDATLQGEDAGGTLVPAKIDGANQADADFLSEQTGRDIHTTLGGTLTVSEASPVDVSALATEASLTTRQPRRDDYSDGEALADQSGADAALTFTFSSEVNLLLVRSVGAASRVDPFGGTPAAATGIIAADDEPTYIPINATTVKVYAPTGAEVAVSGFRY